MLANESARARAARRERQGQREKEAQNQLQLQQFQEKLLGAADQDGHQQMVQQIVQPTDIKQEQSDEAPNAFEAALLQEELDEEVVSRPVRIRKHNRVNDRQRVPMNKWKEEKFTREVLWMYFLNMRHENEGTKEAVIAAVAPELDTLSYKYEDLWKAIMGRVNHLRGQTTGYLKTHVGDMLKLDKNNGGRLNGLKTHAELAAYFQSIYTVGRFLEVFYFTQSIVDLKNQSPLALYYTKSLYANACAKAKLHLDWASQEKAYNEAVELKKRQDRTRAVEKAEKAAVNNDDVSAGNLFGSEDGTTSVTEDAAGDAAEEEEDIAIPPFDKMSPHNREGLVVYLNNFPLAPQFAQVDRKEFVEKNGKKQKKPKAEPTHVAVGMDNLFFDGEPPKPTARRASRSNTR